jgi:hypothetical protein
MINPQNTPSSNAADVSGEAAQEEEAKKDLDEAVLTL